MAILPAAEVARLRRALPFGLSLVMIPLLLLGAGMGGWTLALLPLYGWVMVSVLDAALGLNLENPDPAIPEADLIWYRLITLIWFPLQFAATFGLIWWVTHGSTLSTAEILALFFGVGVISGPVGIVYAHELMHQKPALERWLADLLLALVLYSHFRSEHLLVHHRYVGTPRDAVTAHYNEGFHRFFWRVLTSCPGSAWRAERQMLARAGRGVWHRSNPFWRYGILQGVALVLAYALGGWVGVGLLVFQAGIAVWQLELTNYVEHYGLTRRHLGAGKYEPVRPHHSWNAAQRASNWLLINLQRHSDHHFKPDRRFALLQTYGPDAAPQLPLGYPLMTELAMIPPLWRRRMNPRVRAWRQQHYPDISDWQSYNKALNPLPQGAS